MNNWCIFWVFKAYINEMNGSRSKNSLLCVFLGSEFHAYPKRLKNCEEIGTLYCYVLLIYTFEVFYLKECRYPVLFNSEWKRSRDTFITHKYQ
jgi:hypothetical protein